MAADEAAPPANATDDLPTIVVTATRSAQPAFEVPASVDSVSFDDIDSLAINPSDFLGAIPGVLARDRENYAQDEQISIRGFGARSTFGVRGVRLYADGIPATMPDGQGQVTHFNLDSAERIEVLRGPFSALYGNSSGGVIQIFTADGCDPAALRPTLVVGSFDTVHGSIDACGSAGRAGYNVDLSHFQTGGSRDHSRAMRESGNAKFLVDIDDDHRLTLIANSFHQPEAEDPLGLTREQMQADPQQAVAAAIEFDTRKSVLQNQIGAIYEQDLGSSRKLRFMSYYGRRDIEQFLSIPVAVQMNPLQSGGVIDLGGNYGGLDARWSADGMLAGRPYEIVAGVSADRQDQTRRGYENFVGEEVGIRGRLRRDEEDDVRDLDQYAQARWRFADAWDLMIGVRHSTVKFRTDDHFATSDNPDDSGHVAYSAITPVAGVIFRPGDRVRIHASVGDGFETPTFNELSYRDDGGAGLNFALDPARSRNAEIGVKLRSRSGLEAAFDVFRADTRDELAVARNSGGRSSYRNIGRARRQGAEASLSAHIGDHWTTRIAYTLLDARFRSSFLTCGGSGCTTPTIPVAAGARIPGVPRNDLFAELRWTGGNGWYAQAQANALDTVSVNDIGSDHAAGYCVVGFDLGRTRELPSGDLRTFLRIDNAFDRVYAGSVIVNDGNGRYFEPAAGRSVLLGLRFDWRR
ncbi:MAG TPA: TonB-dependent receptor [Rhodanobacteraceae bacterium]|nr:TonB-dependent receptor [Rhodanobacteraceae bacterium]